MKGIQIGNLRIAIDYSGNFTKGLVHDTDTGDYKEVTVIDIDFDPATEQAAAASEKAAKTVPETV